MNETETPRKLFFGCLVTDNTVYLDKRFTVTPWCQWRELRFWRWNWSNIDWIRVSTEVDNCYYGRHFVVELGLLGFRCDFRLVLGDIDDSKAIIDFPDYDDEEDGETLTLAEFNELRKGE